MGEVLRLRIPKLLPKEDGMEGNRWAMERLHSDHPIRCVQADVDAISTRLHQGDVCIVDLSSLAHMDSQRSALSRQVQDMANYGGLPVFALDDSNRLLLIPGRGSRIDTETHELGGNSIID